MTQEQFNNLMQELGERYNHAAHKHGEFPDKWADGVSLLVEEVGEVSKEVNDFRDKYISKEDAGRVRSELLDVITVAIRFIESIDKKC